MIRHVRWIAAVTATAVVLIVGALIAQGNLDRSLQSVTRWVGDDAGVMWIVGLSLCAAAFLATTPRDALLLATVAIAWVSPVFTSWQGGIGIAAAAAPALAALAVPALWQLLMEATARTGHVRRFAVSLVWIASGAAALALLLLRDPFLDVRCDAECGANPLLIVALPTVVAFAHVTLDAIAGIIGVAALIWSVDRLVRRRPAIGLAPAPALVASGIVGVLLLSASDAAASVRTLEPVLAGALAILAAVRIAADLSAVMRKAALRRLAEDLGAGTERDLRGRLASALGVAELDVLYPLENGRWADASGNVRERPTGVDIAELRREGIPIALVVGIDGHRADLDTIGAAASLAIDNERLRAGVSANLAALRKSRLHVVEAGDDERRRIERNLHDGMQQSLLILQYELGLAATRERDPARRAQLDTIRGEAHRIVERVRDIAHGVFPAALDDLGVEAALQRLVDDAPFPMEVSGTTEPRAPRPVERTVYLVAAEALAAGAHVGPVLTVDLARVDDAVSVRTGNATAQVSRSLRDRVDALGGRLIERENGLEVELPCASS